ncbi:Type cbb3 cytochrome oxidase biogenesis protein CcoG, involved in Cu oxidation [hydrothermal vent metagenome]|uniref:Type cbb3 cytochrome oxidase biogenesis protein CcoG, involved in Cu oxidation n=1 Tax=hydrothermal vent metagenome TaxID=652676 RepID=A0A3B0W5K2_9ZZZZ
MSQDKQPLEIELYESRKKIHPREVTGFFQTLRKLSLFGLLGLFYLIPWFDFQGHQAILFDLPARKFHIFNITFWPQDFIFLSWLLIIAAFLLFFFTALSGRLWCGFACPQTVWTELFIKIEQWTEGNRSKRIKLDKAPWTFNKLRRRGLKNILWIALALWTGFTFVGFFTPIKELLQLVLTWSLGPWETFWIFFYGLATYGNAGFLREQVCLHMCPYARFQSAMFDKDTLIVSYNSKRGEPRQAGNKRRAKIDNVGDCIECTLCVQVCPTGIDIRDGLQYECIACAACIDACDAIMLKSGQPPGLISFTTENELLGKKTHVLRPRIIVYGLVLSIMVGLFTYTLVNRKDIAVDIIRDRNSFYRIIDAQTLENIYTLKIMNKGKVAQQYIVTATGIEGGLRVIVDKQFKDRELAAGEVLSLPIKVRTKIANIKQHIQNIELQIKVIGEHGATITEETKYFGPKK